ncbi:hypothetical protein AB0I81_22570 [Nonomuraea sp. NPDC050404]|uniref:hypothetical protein n=1 Tax=Nonomuraea sp. NPDC050404 TaxID=3155783 RepID=UPI0033EB3694
MARLCFVDVETTSLDDERGEVWEIAAIVRDPGQDDAEYLWQIRPDLTTADPMSLRIGRYYERRRLSIHEVGEAVTVASPELFEEYGPKASPEHTGANDVARTLARMLDGAHVVGAVPDFDFRFLRRFLRRYNECWTAHYHLIDIEALAVGYLQGRAKRDGGDSWVKPADLPWHSKDIYRALGLDWSRGDEHTALGDARLVRSVFDAITGGA